MQQILQRDPGLAQQAAGLFIEGAHTADLEGAAQLQMVLQVLADRRAVMHDFDAVFLQHSAAPDAR